MPAINFFPSDSRSSADKLAIVEQHGQRRLSEMASSEFQTFGHPYWDDPEATAGYGGYRYDGRYRDVAQKMVTHYGLRPGDRVLEVGCGKGYVLVEFHHLGMDVRGMDLSRYAVDQAHPELQGKILCMDMLKADFPPGSFDLVFAKDCLPHLPEERIEDVVKQCQQLSRRHCFFEIEVARSPYEADLLYRWDITHQTRRPPAWWLELFARVGYRGDYHFKVLIEDPHLSPPTCFPESRCRSPALG